MTIYADSQDIADRVIKAHGLKPNKIPHGTFWSEESKKLYMQYCPKCGMENYAPAVASGICAWCGYDVNK